MAYATTPLSASVIADAVANKPILLANANQSAPSAVQWRTGGSWAAGADDSDASYPTYRAYDNLAVAYTRPTTAALVQYLLFDFSTAPITFDSIVLLGSNHADLAAPVSVLVQIADDNAFTVNLQAVAVWSNPTAGRLVEIGGLLNQYSNVQWLRVAWSNLAVNRPTLSEIWLSTRRQMPQHPLHPWDPDHKGYSERSVFSAESGESAIYASHTGRGDLDLSINFKDATNADVMRGAWADCFGGSRRIICIPRPYTDERDARLMVVPPPGLVSAQTSGVERARYTLPMRECPPFVGSEGL